LNSQDDLSRIRGMPGLPWGNSMTQTQVQRRQGMPVSIRCKPSSFQCCPIVLRGQFQHDDGGREDGCGSAHLHEVQALFQLDEGHYGKEQPHDESVQGPIQDVDELDVLPENDHAPPYLVESKSIPKKLPRSTVRFTRMIQRNPHRRPGSCLICPPSCNSS